MKPTYDYLYKSHVVSALDCANAGLTRQQLTAWLEGDGWRLNHPENTREFWVRESGGMWVDTYAIHGGADAIAHLVLADGRVGLDILAEMVSFPEENVPEPELTLDEEARRIAIALKNGCHSSVTIAYQRLSQSDDADRRDLAHAFRAYESPEFSIKGVKARSAQVRKHLREGRLSAAVTLVLEELGEPLPCDHYYMKWRGHNDSEGAGRQRCIRCQEFRHP